MKGTDGSVDGRGNDDSNSEEAGLAEPQKGQVRRVWYRSVPFQIAVASGVSFTAPGMWDALGGLGAGGAAEPVSDKTCTRLRNSILILQTVRCFGSQCPGLRSLFRLLRPRGSNQQPHRPEIRSCSRCNRLSSLRSRSIHQQCSSYDVVPAIRKCSMRNLCWFLLGRRSSRHHRISKPQGTSILPGYLADRKGIRSNRRRRHQPRTQRKSINCRISGQHDIHRLHRNHVSRPPHRPAAQPSLKSLAERRHESPHQQTAHLRRRVQGYVEAVDIPPDLAFAPGLLHKLLL